MTSVENQDQAEKRIPTLIHVPAVIRGLSVEPLLGPVDLTPWLDQVQWVIIGGESGRDARPMNPNWVCDIRDQCLAAGVAFFFKQWGEWAPITLGTESHPELWNDTKSWRSRMQRLGKKAAGRLLDGRTWNALPTVDLAQNAINNQLC
jgi:protein gp37